MNGIAEVGWTPPPVQPTSLNSRHLNKYHRGHGYANHSPPKVAFNKAGAHIKLEVGFRIDDWKAKWGSYLVFGSGVPYMRITLDLEIRSGGNHKVIFNGSFIPTQIYQIGNNQPMIYDMVNDIGGYHEVERALGVGFERPAPERPKHPKFQNYIP
ncbi:MAG: hypothetical protein M3347_13440 [Armatimonadota bacterium]|nr:hypothetical protein [Armatimonadota bacterium]